MYSPVARFLHDLDRERYDMEGVCPKCFSVFERPDHIPVGHPGYFCPVCKEKGYLMIGIVHFTPDPEPFEFTPSPIW